MYRTEYASPVGQLTLASDGEAITGLWLPRQKYALSTLDPKAEVCPDLQIFHKAAVWLDAYFAGEPLPPLPPLSPEGTPFRRAVWELLLEIPYGMTATYGELAEKLRMSGRSASAIAVGGAVGHNPISILIPCHRCIGADGSLTGYAGGLEIKRFLLELEAMEDSTL